ncbi:MAG: transposase [Sphingobacteriales bacterium]|nr:transposase [Sphingobacteriales bacterium]
MLLDNVYFWTSTIKDWKTLLAADEYKIIIVDTLKELVSREKIIVYAFVIMPNHVHLVWEMKTLNGKEMPHASFNKFTAHQFQKLLRQNNPELLLHFKVEETERKYRFWQRDALAVLMDSKEKVIQKIDYIHHNPLQEKWGLAKTPESYKWSSANFYETDLDKFNFLTNITEAF